jgi:EAL domain-containing protein (putative c-di-GMP-specific phosphodiesterase class I)
MLIALSSNLEVTTIAEGLETKEDMDWLMKNGCAQAQGFFLGHPLPWEKLNL